MLHNKFRGNRPAGSGDFLRGFTIYGRGGHFGHVAYIMSSDIPSFVEIGLPVPEKKIFKGFLPYMDMAAILVM